MNCLRRRRKILEVILLAIFLWALLVQTVHLLYPVLERYLKSRMIHLEAQDICQLIALFLAGLSGCCGNHFTLQWSLSSLTTLWLINLKRKNLSVYQLETLVSIITSLFILGTGNILGILVSKSFHRSWKPRGSSRTTQSLDTILERHFPKPASYLEAADRHHFYPQL